MVGILEQLRCFYTGTSKELEESLSFGLASVMVLLEGFYTGLFLEKLVEGEFDYLTFLTFPFALDMSFRVKYMITKSIENIKNGKWLDLDMKYYFPGVIGHYREKYYFIENK